MSEALNEYITDLIRKLEGVVQATPLSPTDEGIDLFTQVYLDGTHEAWLAVSDLKASGAHVQLQHIEGMDGNSDWLVIVERESIEDFAAALRDVVAVVSAISGGMGDLPPGL